MVARRLLILAAVLVLLTALAAGLAPRQSPRDDGIPGAGDDAVPARTVQKTISTEPGADTSVRVRRGDVLELAVSGNTLDSVELERLDREDAIEPTTPARFELFVDAPRGVYPIRLVDADRRIGRIEIVG